ncbi:unnamed protein product, partial [Meganyctiphanes norvegica]
AGNHCNQPAENRALWKKGSPLLTLLATQSHAFQTRRQKQIPPGYQCMFGGKPYEHGETWMDGDCRMYTCLDGYYIYENICNTDCSADNGETYMLEEVWYNGCEVCTCLESGTLCAEDINC